MGLGWPNPLLDQAKFQFWCKQLSPSYIEAQEGHIVYNKAQKKYSSGLVSNHETKNSAFDDVGVPMARTSRVDQMRRQLLIP